MDNTVVNESQELTPLRPILKPATTTTSKESSSKKYKGDRQDQTITAHQHQY